MPMCLLVQDWSLSIKMVHENKTSQFGNNSSEKLFNVFVCSAAIAIIVTIVNVFVYNWVFLRFVYAADVDWFSLVKIEMIKGYYSWVFGKILCLLNIVSLLTPVFIWFMLKYVVNRDK